MKIATPNIEHYPSVEKISNSYDTLKEGVGELAGQVKSEASEAASTIKMSAVDFMKEKLASARSEMSSDVDKVKLYVKEEPVKGIAMAFLAGALVSVLMRRS